MYGGSGRRPWASISSNTSPFEVQGEEFAGALAGADLEGVGQADARTRLGRLRRAHLRQHGARSSTRSTSTSTWPPDSFWPKKRAFSTRVLFITSSVAGLELVDDVGKMAVGDAVTVELQQARSAAVGQRHLRDALGRQVEIEVGEGVDSAHDGKTVLRSLTIEAQAYAANPLFYTSLYARNQSRQHAPTNRHASHECQTGGQRQQPNPVQKTIESKLAKLGLRTDMDLVLHLPMRYEDETEIVPIREACLRGGHVSQVEGVVTKNEITYKPRKQLLVSIADETSDIQLRFMNFYGSQVKQLAEGHARAGARRGAPRLLRRRDGPPGV
jgi:hypothetical protein